MADLTDKFKPNAAKGPFNQKELDEMVLEAAAVQDTRTLGLALMAGGNPNARNKANGEPAVVYSASNGNVQHLKLLLEAGADINATDNFGQTAAMEALHGRHEKALAYILASDYEVDHRDTTNNTLLMHAVRCMELKPVRLVLDADPDPFVKDAKGRTARAILEGLRETASPEVLPVVDKILTMLVRHEERYFGFMLNDTVDRKEYDKMKDIAHAGLDMGRNSYAIGQALIIAVKATDEKAVEILLGAGADLHVHDNYGCSVRSVISAGLNEAGMDKAMHDRLEAISLRIDGHEQKLLKPGVSPPSPR